LVALTDKGLLSRATAISSIADIYKVDDVADELSRIGAMTAR
jgi:hypothetical protein